MGRMFAVIDTETTWNDSVMSIGVVVADYDTFDIKEKMYYVITPTYKQGGMFYDSLNNTRGTKIDVLSRRDAISELKLILKQYDVNHIFAYNANFDYRHLPELKSFIWVDIMRIAAYRQHNPRLPRFADYCATGRLRSGYGVEEIYTYLSGRRYIEYHNAICDAEDEMHIVKMLNKNLCEVFNFKLDS